MSDADALAETLASGDTSIGLAAYALGWTPYRVYSTAKSDPARFAIIGIVGTMRTWSIALAGDRPIQMVLPAAWRKELR